MAIHKTVPQIIPAVTVLLLMPVGLRRDRKNSVGTRAIVPPMANLTALKVSGDTWYIPADWATYPAPHISVAIIIIKLPFGFEVFMGKFYHSGGFCQLITCCYCAKVWICYNLRHKEW